MTCGYASIKDVRTMQKEDRMDSFVLAETFKYLYLLFSEDSDLLIDIDSFVFTTVRIHYFNLERFFFLNKNVLYTGGPPTSPFLGPVIPFHHSANEEDQC